MTQHVVVTGLGFGDEAKGLTVARLAAAAAGPVTVVRYNGGCQCAHNVVTDDGRHHTFAQFGSGTLSGASTFLSRFMMVEPFALLREAEHLKELGVSDPLSMLKIDRECLVTTPFHWIANREREIQRGGDRHGSCGRGVGETAQYALERPGAALRVQDLGSYALLRWKLQEQRDQLVQEFPNVDVPSVDELARRYEHEVGRLRLYDGDELAREAAWGDKLIFEGAQGVLLDEWFGFHPYTTWSTTTSENARTLLAEIGVDDYKVMGVVRSYGTRHGPGPFPTEDVSLDLSDTHNGEGEWQGGWRVGHFDAPLLNYAIKVNGGVDEIALTHMDKADDVKQCIGYQLDGTEVREIPVGARGYLQHQEFLTRRLFEADPIYLEERVDIVDLVEEIADAPVTSKGYGPKMSDVRASVTAR